MRKFLLISCVTVCFFAILIPAVSSIGGDQGWIQIRCNVDGASVSFDGQYQGIISGGQLTVSVYSTGTPYNSYTVENAGYYPYTSTITTMPGIGQTVTYYATLNPIPPPTPSYGSLYIESSPSGAAIYLNGNYRGSAPLTLNQVNPGSYTIEAELDGYRPYTTTTTVSLGTRSNVYCVLTKLDTSGSLYVISDPTSSNVYLDGSYKGRTPLTINNIASGTHTLEIDHTGYYDWKSTVNVPQGGTRTVSGTLNPLPTSNVGWIYVSSSPGGASVTLDGMLVGQTPSSGSLKLNTIATGDHTVKVELTGYQPHSTRVSVQANTVTEVNAVLQPVTPPSATGTLSISSTPLGANIILDNRLVGVTPLTLTNVSIGIHNVIIRLDRYQDYTTVVEVNSGITSTVSAALNPVTSPTQKSGTLPIVACGALAIMGVLTMRKIR